MLMLAITVSYRGRKERRATGEGEVRKTLYEIAYWRLSA